MRINPHFRAADFDRRCALWIVLVLFSGTGWAAIPEGYRQVWEMAGRGEVATALPALLKIIDDNPAFAPGYKTLAQIFVRTHDEAGLVRVLAQMNPAYKPIALAEYYSRLRPSELENVAKACADSSSAPTGCFDLWRYFGLREAQRRLRSWPMSRPQAPAACIAWIRLRLIAREFDLAHREAETCLAEAVASDDKQFLLNATEALADVTYMQSNSDRAILLFSHLADLAEELADYDVALHADRNQVSILDDLGRQDESDNLMARRWEKTRANRNDFHFVSLAHEETSRSCRKGLPEEAQEWLEQAVQGYARLGLEEPDSLRYAVGSAYVQTGDFVTARHLLQVHLERLRKAGQNVSQQSFVLRSLASLAFELGDWYEALKLNLESVDIFNRLGMTHQAGAGLGNIGLVYASLGDYPNAFNYIQQSLDSGIRQRDPSEVVRNLGDRARVRQRMGDLTGALIDLNRAAQNTAGVPRLIHESLNLSISGVLLELKRPTEAAQHAEPALIFARQSHSTSLEADAELMLGDSQLQQRHWDEAERNYQRSLEAARRGPYYDGVVAAESRLAKIALHLGRLDQEFVHLDSALRMIESDRMRIPTPELRTGFTRQIAGVYEAAVTNRILSGNPIEALLLSERNRARGFLDTMLEPHVQMAGKLSPEFERQYVTLTTRLSRAMSSMLAEDTGGTRARTLEAERKLDEWFTRVRLSSPSSLKRQNPPAITPEQIHSLAATLHSTLVVFALGNDRSYVWVVTPNNIELRTLAGRGQIEREVSVLRTALAIVPSPATAPAYLRPARRLYELLLEPLRLPANENVVVIPDGNLYYLPFDVLIASKTEKRHLVEERIISYAPSLSVLLGLSKRARRPTFDRTLVAFGDPTFGSRTASPSNDDVVRHIYRSAGIRFSPLPGTRREITAIASVFSPDESQTYLGIQAAEATVKSEHLRRYRYIHFATHALIDETFSSRSGIVLSMVNRGSDDGVLRMNEIVNLEMDADLVTLSACQSGLGRLVRGEGMIGLTRAFFLAGASRVAVSLWQVNDLSGSYLMRPFYSGLAQGQSPALALRNAKLDMLRSQVPAYRHPYFWSGFVLNGLN